MMMLPKVQSLEERTTREASADQTIVYPVRGCEVWHRVAAAVEAQRLSSSADSTAPGPRFLQRQAPRQRRLSISDGAVWKIAPMPATAHAGCPSRRRRSDPQQTAWVIGIARTPLHFRNGGYSHARAWTVHETSEDLNQPSGRAADDEVAGLQPRVHDARSQVRAACTLTGSLCCYAHLFHLGHLHLVRSRGVVHTRGGVRVERNGGDRYSALYRNSCHMM